MMNGAGFGLSVVHISCLRYVARRLKTAGLKDRQAGLRRLPLVMFSVDTLGPTGVAHASALVTSGPQAQMSKGFGLSVLHISCLRYVARRLRTAGLKERQSGLRRPPSGPPGWRMPPRLWPVDHKPHEAKVSGGRAVWRACAHDESSARVHRAGLALGHFGEPGSATPRPPRKNFLLITSQCHPMRGASWLASLEGIRGFRKDLAGNRDVHAPPR